MANSNKTKTIRAFTTENKTETKVHINLLQMLQQAMETRRTLETRLMPLSASEEKGESDLLTSWKCERGIFQGIVRPVLPTDLTSSLPASFFGKEKVTTEELIQEATRSEVFTTLPPCYFAISDEYIVALFSNKYSQRRFETYINWLTAEIRKDYWIDFIDVISLPSNTVLATTSAITIGNNTTISTVDSSTPFRSVIKKLSSEVLDMLGNLEGFKDLDFKLEDVLELSLLFKVSRKNISKEEAELHIGKLARLFSQEKDVVLKTKSGNISIDKELKRTKNIPIETTSQGSINEAILFAELEKFLFELKQ